MTRSSIARLIRYAIKSGSLTPDTSPVGMAAYIRGYQRARFRRAGLSVRAWNR